MFINNVRIVRATLFAHFGGPLTKQRGWIEIVARKISRKTFSRFVGHYNTATVANVSCDISTFSYGNVSTRIT